MAGTAIQLVTILRSTFVSLPDAFIVNPLWALHSDKLDAILLRSSPHPNPIVTRTILADLADLKSRRHISSESSSHDDSSVESRNFETIRLLDEIAFPSSIATTHRKLFHNRGRKRTVAQELPTLFAWAISPDRYGSYRSYAVGKLIALELATPSGSDKVIDVEGGFISWIDTVRPEEWDKVRLLLAELIRARVVSYSSYLHRMIARGETEAKADSVRPFLSAELDDRPDSSNIDPIATSVAAQNRRPLRRTWTSDLETSFGSPRIAKRSEESHRTRCHRRSGTGVAHPRIDRNEKRIDVGEGRLFKII